MKKIMEELHYCTLNDLYLVRDSIEKIIEYRKASINLFGEFWGGGNPTESFNGNEEIKHAFDIPSKYKESSL